MNIEQVRLCCLSLPGAGECFPFGKFPRGGDVLVFKVEGKIFLMCDLADPPLRIEVKCAPEYAEMLRGRYRAVEKGFANGWNTILLSGDMGSEELRRWIEHSYRQVIAGLPRRLREKYA